MVHRAPTWKTVVLASIVPATALLASFSSLYSRFFSASRIYEADTDYSYLGASHAMLSGQMPWTLWHPGITTLWLDAAVISFWGAVEGTSFNREALAALYISTSEGQLLAIGIILLAAQFLASVWLGYRMHNCFQWVPIIVAQSAPLFLLSIFSSYSYKNQPEALAVLLQTSVLALIAPMLFTAPSSPFPLSNKRLNTVAILVGVVCGLMILTKMYLWPWAVALPLVFAHRKPIALAYLASLCCVFMGFVLYIPRIPWMLKWYWDLQSGYSESLTESFGRLPDLISGNYWYLPLLASAILLLVFFRAVVLGRVRRRTTRETQLLPAGKRLVVTSSGRILLLISVGYLPIAVALQIRRGSDGWILPVLAPAAMALAILIQDLFARDLRSKLGVFVGGALVAWWGVGILNQIVDSSSNAISSLALEAAGQAPSSQLRFLQQLQLQENSLVVFDYVNVSNSALSTKCSALIFGSGFGRGFADKELSRACPNTLLISGIGEDHLGSWGFSESAAQGLPFLTCSEFERLTQNRSQVLFVNQPDAWVATFLSVTRAPELQGEFGEVLSLRDLDCGGARERSQFVPRLSNVERWRSNYPLLDRALSYWPLR